MAGVVRSLAFLAVLLSSVSYGQAFFSTDAEQISPDPYVFHQQLDNITGRPNDRLTLIFKPSAAVGIVEGFHATIPFVYTLQSNASLSIRFEVVHSGNVQLINSTDFTFVPTPNLRLPINYATENSSTSYNFTALQVSNSLIYNNTRLVFKGIFLGRTRLRMYIKSSSSDDIQTAFKYRISVIRYMRPIDRIFIFVIVGFVINCKYFYGYKT